MSVQTISPDTHTANTLFSVAQPHTLQYKVRVQLLGRQKRWSTARPREPQHGTLQQNSAPVFAPHPHWCSASVSIRVLSHVFIYHKYMWCLRLTSGKEIKPCCALMYGIFGLCSAFPQILSPKPSSIQYYNRRLKAQWNIMLLAWNHSSF